MDQLILHDHTRMQLKALETNAPHALVLVGPAGIGKRAIAQAWAANLTIAAGITVIEPDEKGTISIDAIRALYQRTRSKQKTWQVVIVDHAEALGNEAQNSFLKLLEEPRNGVTFILTAPTLDALLPTISSRTQHVLVHKVSQQAITDMLPATLSASDRAKLLFMADGRPATLHKLISDEAYFAKQGELMQKARTLLTASQYQRVAAINELIKNKDDVIFVLEAVAYMLKVQITRDASPKHLAFADALNVTLERLAHNGNARAQLTHLFTAPHLL